MTLKEYAEKEGITLDEAKKITGLTHWKQTVPESCDEIPEIPESVNLSEVTESVIETESKQEEVVKEPKPVKQHIIPPKDLDLTDEKNFSIFILGNKSPHWNK